MSLMLTPSWELVEKWLEETWLEGAPVQVSASDCHIAEKAAQWGADQELKACCEWIDGIELDWKLTSDNLRSARRPSTLKARALANLDGLCVAFGLTKEADAIREALETLPD